LACRVEQSGHKRGLAGRVLLEPVDGAALKDTLHVRGASRDRDRRPAMCQAAQRAAEHAHGLAPQNRDRAEVQHHAGSAGAERPIDSAMERDHQSRVDLASQSDHLSGGELDLAGVPAFDYELRRAEAHATLVVVDLRELEFIDTSGACLLLEADRRVRGAGGRLLVVRGRAEVLRPRGERAPRAPRSSGSSLSSASIVNSPTTFSMAALAPSGCEPGDARAANGSRAKTTVCDISISLLCNG
jgi:ABC-type transporter Mla MlaB component